MPKKILFWFGADFTHFCLSHYLQKEIDAEFFAIIDITNKPKSFFKHQDLVDIKKQWFFHDHIHPNTKQPDLNYLREIEKKYDLNIWKLALNERLFYRFYNFHKFTSNEILSIDEQACKLFEKILDEVKPDFFITKQPALHHLELFYQICRARGIKVLMLNNSNFGNTSIIVEDISKFDGSLTINDFESDNRTFDELQKSIKDLKENLKTTLFKKTKKSSFIKSALRLLISNDKNVLTNYNYFGRTKFKIFSYEMKYRLNSYFRKKFIDKKLVTKPDLNTKFIYFPLSLEMERSTLIDAPFYTNDIEVVRSIAKSIPVDQILYVKEHPSAFLRGWRKISEYKEILDIPNVVLIHPDFSSEQLYKHTSLVITIGGSAGFEGALYGKPSIIFNELRYSILPCVYRLKSIEELPNAISNSINTKVDVNDVNKFIKLLEHVTIDFNWLEAYTEFEKLFYNDATSRDTNIPIQEMKKFLEKNKVKLEKLALEHIKKMDELLN